MLTAATLIRRRSAVRMVTSERQLGALWASVVEVMLCNKYTGGSNVHLVPAATRPPLARAAGALPSPPFGNHVIFALTAFDPPGVERTLEENTAANGDLHRGILELAPPPRHVWPTWGYNLDEGWREDGFSLAYPLSQTDEGRTAVVALACRFGQGAIFEYAPGPEEDALTRTTVPAMSSDDVKEVVTVWRVPAELPDDAPPMLRRPWAGPAEAL
eukprot:CAMPEP_0185489198 /NCGR_PEP_ID=MMETSP1366-20130426/12971_1 /TAXON_ID=38817 /ORGANISM="Gephyrocapsa oceanica, Strain RCC1303" /LENGTH=214 /DNA_ID=CAMNT_0028097757 /DNA_START=1 /DNA_END=645 /DNA_ORIENTATION=-